MGQNYKNVRGAVFSIYEGETADALLRESDVFIDEMYYDDYSGDIELHFEVDSKPQTWVGALQGGGYMRIDYTAPLDGDDRRDVWLNIPVKATGNWNGFVDSLPKWRESESD